MNFTYLPIVHPATLLKKDSNKGIFIAILQTKFKPLNRLFKPFLLNISG